MIKLGNVVSKGDVVKITILLITSIGCWIWVWTEYQKPAVPLQRVVPTEIIEE